MDKFVLSIVSDPANEILPGLWLGSLNALNPTFLENIDTVINMTKSIPAHAGVTTYNFPLRDIYTDNPVMIKMLPRAISLIDKEIREGKRVLVHCRAGAQRSATVIAAYLMRYHRMSLKNAVSHIRERRGIALTPHMTFKPALKFMQ